VINAWIMREGDPRNRRSHGAWCHAKEILKMVLLGVARWTIGGAILGSIGAWFCTRSLESLLCEVKSHDPVLYCGAVLLLLAAAFVAGWSPAHRAMRIDPMVALRYE
jgi:hypothetical protein